MMPLYKYVTHERIDVLRNRLIRFSPAIALNDPWEARPYLAMLISDETLSNDFLSMERLTSESFMDRVVESVVKDAKASGMRLSRKQAKARILEIRRTNSVVFKNLLVSTQEHVRAEFRRIEPELKEQFIRLLRTQIGILSLAAKRDEELMWSHYADSHSGFVIEFDESHAFFTSRTSKKDDWSGLHKIQYASQLPRIREFNSLAEPGMGWIPLLFTKSKKWEAEEEWRMVRPLEQADKIIPLSTGDIHLFALPPGCVSAVILGSQMTADTKRAVMDLLRSDSAYGHIKTFQTVLHEQDYRIQIIPA